MGSKSQPSRRVIAIIRVSTQGQVGEDKYGQSRQRHDIAQAAAMHDLEIIRTIEVVESGSTAFRREDFQQVFTDLARPDVAGAIVAAVDRLVRPGFLGDLQVFDPFQKHGKLLFAGAQCIDLATEGDWVTAGMFGLSSGMHKRAILKATLGAKERARHAGKHPQGPQMLARGLGYSKSDGWFYTEDASKVKKCYDLLFAGTSFDDIAKAVGFKTGRGVAWILRNTCWKAIRTYPPNTLRAVPLEKPMGIEPLISPARWAKAQDILDRKRTATRARRRQEYEIALGLGLLRCGCGRFLYLRREYRPGRHSYYFCGSGHRGVWCGAPSIQRLKADAEFERAVVSFADVATVRAMVEQALSKPAGKKPSAANAQREIARVTGEQERLIDMRIKGKITEEQFDARDRKLAGDRRDLEAQLPKAATGHRPEDTGVGHRRAISPNSRTCPWRNNMHWRIEPSSPSRWTRKRRG